MTQVKFVSRISSMGKVRLIIHIPKIYHDEVERIKAKQIRVTIEAAV